MQFLPRESECWFQKPEIVAHQRSQSNDSILLLPFNITIQCCGMVLPGDLVPKDFIISSNLWKSLCKDKNFHPWEFFGLLRWTIVTNKQDKIPFVGPFTVRGGQLYFWIISKSIWCITLKKLEETLQLSFWKGQQKVLSCGDKRPFLTRIEFAYDTEDRS